MSLINLPKPSVLELPPSAPAPRMHVVVTKRMLEVGAAFVVAVVLAVAGALYLSHGHPATRHARETKVCCEAAR
jgi:hypothetical protein